MASSGRLAVPLQWQRGRGLAGRCERCRRSGRAGAAITAGRKRTTSLVRAGGCRHLDRYSEHATRTQSSPDGRFLILQLLCVGNTGAPPRRVNAIHAALCRHELPQDAAQLHVQAALSINLQQPVLLLSAGLLTHAGQLQLVSSGGRGGNAAAGRQQGRAAPLGSRHQLLCRGRAVLYEVGGAAGSGSGCRLPTPSTSRAAAGLLLFDRVQKREVGGNAAGAEKRGSPAREMPQRRRSACACWPTACTLLPATLQQ